jgi:hypothetical protein
MQRGIQRPGIDLQALASYTHHPRSPQTTLLGVNLRQPPVGRGGAAIDFIERSRPH